MFLKNPPALEYGPIRSDSLQFVLARLGHVRMPPKKAAQGAILWALEGQLHSQDPRQARMEFRAVDTQTAVRDVGHTGNWPAPGSEEVDAYRHEGRDAEEVS